MKEEMRSEAKGDFRDKEKFLRDKITFDDCPPGETNTEEDFDKAFVLSDPKWEKEAVTLTHNPYSKESIVKKKISRSDFQLPAPEVQISPDDDTEAPRRLNVGSKDIERNFNYKGIQRDFVINSKTKEEDEYDDFAFKWTDKQPIHLKTFESSSSEESSSSDIEADDYIPVVDSGVESEQTSNSNLSMEGTTGQQEVDQLEEEEKDEDEEEERMEMNIELKVSHEKVTSLADLWERKVQESEAESKQAHLSWKASKPQYLGWRKDNLIFKPKPVITAEETEDDTLEDCSSIEEAEEAWGRRAEEEVQYAQYSAGEEGTSSESEDEVVRRKRQDDPTSFQEDEEGEEEVDKHTIAGPEVASLRARFEQLSQPEKEGLPDNRGLDHHIVQLLEHDTYSYHDDDSESEELDVHGGDEGLEDQDEMTSAGGQKGLSEVHEKERRVGALSVEMLQPFLATGSHQVEARVEEEELAHIPEDLRQIFRQHGNADVEDEINSEEEHSILPAVGGERQVGVLSVGMLQPFQTGGSLPALPQIDFGRDEQYTELTDEDEEEMEKSVSSGNYEQEREDITSSSSEDEKYKEERALSPPIKEDKARKTSVMEIRERLVQQAHERPRKAEPEAELAHIPKDLRQFFRSSSQENIIEEEEREENFTKGEERTDNLIKEKERVEIGGMIARFRQETHWEDPGRWVISPKPKDNVKDAEEANSSNSSEDELVEGSLGLEKEVSSDNRMRARRLSMERLNLFQIPS